MCFLRRLVGFIVEHHKLPYLLKPGVNHALHDHRFLALSGRVGLARRYRHHKRSLAVQGAGALRAREPRRERTLQKTDDRRQGDQRPVFFRQCAGLRQLFQKIPKPLLCPGPGKINPLKQFVVGRAATSLPPSCGREKSGAESPSSRSSLSRFSSEALHLT